jgi:hypothetical protein
MGIAAGIEKKHLVQPMVGFHIVIHAKCQKSEKRE